MRSYFYIRPLGHVLHSGKFVSETVAADTRPPIKKTGPERPLVPENETILKQRQHDGLTRSDNREPLAPVPQTNPANSTYQMSASSGPESPTTLLATERSGFTGDHAGIIDTNDLGVLYGAPPRNPHQQPYQSLPPYNTSCHGLLCLEIFNESLLDITINETSSFLGGAAASAGETNWYMMLLVLIALCGVLGNVLVCLAISLEKKLRNITNYFLMSLAVADLMVNLLVMPLSIVNEITGYWQLGASLCNLWITCDVLLCTSSILHMSTISLDRYIGIRSPLKSRNKSMRVVALKILLVWMLSFVIACPILILGIVDSANVLVNGVCGMFNSHFVIYGSITAFFIPLVGMMVTYSLTVSLLREKARQCRRSSKEGQPMIRRSTSKRRRKQRGCGASGGGSDDAGNNHRLLSTSVEEEEESATTPVRTPLCQSRASAAFRTLHANFRDTKSQNGRIPKCLGTKNNKELTSDELEPLTPPSPGLMHDSQNNICEPPLRKLERQGTAASTNSNSSAISLSPAKIPKRSNTIPFPSSSGDADGAPRFRGLVQKHSMAIKAATIMLQRRDAIERREKEKEVKTEQKAAKVLGVLFGIFVICWSPFFLVNIMTPLCTSCVFDDRLLVAFLWLGYISSTINPIIYTIFNQNFRVTFIKLLLCRYKQTTVNSGKVYKATPIAAVCHNGNGPPKAVNNRQEQKQQQQQQQKPDQQKQDGVDVGSDEPKSAQQFQGRTYRESAC